MLAESYLPGEGVPVHATWAAHLETIPTDGVDELRRLGDLATHHERAGEGMAAFAALVQGADLAEKLGAGREAADLLARAAGLWRIGADPADTFGQARLLERAGRACTFAGRAKEGYQLLRMASDLVSPERDPLWSSRLLLRMMAAENRSGEHQPHESPATLERVVDLSSVDPDSREHAEALGWLAYALYWRERRTRVANWRRPP